MGFFENISGGSTSTRGSVKSTEIDVPSPTNVARNLLVRLFLREIAAVRAVHNTPSNKGTITKRDISE